MFKPMLCEDYAKAEKLTFPKAVSAKLDGIRCVTIEGDALTRSKKPIPNLHIRYTLRQYQDLDGEIIIGKPTDPDVYRNTNSAVMSHEGEPQFTYYVFDELSGLNLTFAERHAHLKKRALPEFIQLLPQVLIESEDDLMSMYKGSLEDGLEGLILRDPLAAYKFGRYTAKSQGALKMKPVADSDAVVISAYEAMHNGNEAFKDELGRTDRSTAAEGLVPSGMLGGFFARDVATGVEFDCAPGVLTHGQRRELWQLYCADPAQLIGRLFKYRHMPYGVKDKPRFPRFIGWRSSLDTGE